jgi:hypothetical protein
VKRRRATLESDPPRDNRTGRRISVEGEDPARLSPARILGYPEPPMPRKLAVRGRCLRFIETGTESYRFRRTLAHRQRQGGQQ